MGNFGFSGKFWIFGEISDIHYHDVSLSSSSSSSFAVCELHIYSFRAIFFQDISKLFSVDMEMIDHCSTSQNVRLPHSWKSIPFSWKSILYSQKIVPNLNPSLMYSKKQQNRRSQRVSTHNDFLRLASQWFLKNSEIPKFPLKSEFSPKIQNFPSKYYFDDDDDDLVVESNVAVRI